MRKIHVLLSFWEKPFSYLSWLSLLLILESWVLNLDLLNLDSWNLILDSWNQLSSWILKCSWFYLGYLELILWLTFELFVITFVIIFCYHLLLSSLLSSKHLWITLDSSWSFASTISPFLMMTTSKIKKHTHTIFPSRSLT